MDHFYEQDGLRVP